MDVSQVHKLCLMDLGILFVHVPHFPSGWAEAFWVIDKCTVFKGMFMLTHALTHCTKTKTLLVAQTNQHSECGLMGRVRCFI